MFNETRAVRASTKTKERLGTIEEDSDSDEEGMVYEKNKNSNLLMDTMIGRKVALQESTKAR